jgi:hypothetical protein
MSCSSGVVNMTAAGVAHVSLARVRRQRHEMGCGRTEKAKEVAGRWRCRSAKQSFESKSSGNFQQGEALFVAEPLPILAYPECLLANPYWNVENDVLRGFTSCQ